MSNDSPPTGWPRDEEDRRATGVHSACTNARLNAVTNRHQRLPTKIGGQKANLRLRCLQARRLIQRLKGQGLRLRWFGFEAESGLA